MKKLTERKEALMRIPVLIVSGIVLGVWRYLICIFALINFIYTLTKNKRFEELSTLSEIWNTQWYNFQKYITFVTNKRPFPFTSLQKSIGRFE